MSNFQRPNLGHFWPLVADWWRREKGRPCWIFLASDCLRAALEMKNLPLARFRLGPNLWQEFHSDTIPTPTDVPDADNKPTFWKVDGGYLVLNMTCNWRFVNLNEKFRPSTEFAPTHPLHVYCNVGIRSMVGDRVTDLLREIKYHTQETTHFELIHIHYLPV